MRRSLATLVVTVFIMGYCQGTATAATTTRLDARGDAPALIDIVRVKYSNGSHRVFGRIQVDALRRQGRATLIVGPPTASDFAYNATVRVDQQGQLRKSFWLVSDGGSVRRSCDFAARWYAGKDRIRIAVPQRCVKSLGGHKLYVGSKMQAASHVDFGPPVRHLARG